MINSTTRFCRFSYLAVLVPSPRWGFALQTCCKEQFSKFHKQNSHTNDAKQEDQGNCVIELTDKVKPHLKSLVSNSN